VHTDAPPQYSYDICVHVAVFKYTNTNCRFVQSSISSVSTPAKAALDDASAAVATVSGDAVTSPVTAATRAPLFNRLDTGFHPANRHATAVDKAVAGRVGGGAVGESGGGQSGLQIGPGLHWQWVQH